MLWIKYFCLDWIEIIYNGFVNLGYLVTSRLTFKRKLQVFLVYIKINLKCFFGAKLLKLKSENILGFHMTGFDYGTIRYLFEEVFLRNEYFFESETDSPVIIDAGANIGFATIYFKWLYPNCVIHSFEPDPSTFHLLEVNVRKNNLNQVIINNFALAETDGEIDFYIDSDRPGSLLMSTKFERMPKSKISVRSISLSKYLTVNSIKKLDFAKIDIEGAELSVLKDLDNSGKLLDIVKLSIEYHHLISGEKSSLSVFLNILERNHFEYQIDSKSLPISNINTFQDILLYSYHN